jgi:hypothetical protein
MGAPEVEAFLTHLAVKEHGAASTQNPCTVLTKDQTLRLIGCLLGTRQLMAKLIYDRRSVTGDEVARRSGPWGLTREQVCEALHGMWYNQGDEKGAKAHHGKHDPRHPL